MSNFLAVSIDVEPDCRSDWRRSDPLTFENVRIGIAEILQPVFAEYRIRPTYLISPEVLEHDQSVKILANLGDCELGTHLHSEYIDPSRKYLDPAGTRSSEFPSNLPDDLHAAKLASLTELFRKCFGYMPKSYRAARFGANDTTFRTLAELGYKVDTSVTPQVNWRSKGGPDFRGFANQPYWLESGKLLEVPVTIGPKRFFLLPAKWFCYRWLRPSIMTVFEMKRLISRILRDRPDGAVLNMMFHSMELIPGASPYVSGRAGQRKFLQKLESVFSHTSSLGIVAKTLSEIYNVFSDTGGD